MTKNTLFTIVILALFCVIVAIVHYSQTNKETDANPIEDEQSVVIDTVKSFWQLTEAGEIEKATELTTDTHKEFTVTVKGAVPAAKWLKGRGFQHTEVAINRKKSDDFYEVRVRVVDDRQRKYWLFHDVVRTLSGEWRILTTSF